MPEISNCITRLEKIVDIIRQGVVTSLNLSAALRSALTPDLDASGVQAQVVGTSDIVRGQPRRVSVDLGGKADEVATCPSDGLADVDVRMGSLR